MTKIYAELTSKAHELTDQNGKHLLFFLLGYVIPRLDVEDCNKILQQANEFLGRQERTENEKISNLA